MAGVLPEVDGYSDLVEIGRGGFARVYRAHQVRFNRAVALKVLNLADPDERTRNRFERECQAMGELSWHPHVVAVYDSGITDDGHLWLAMEHLQRGSLADAVGTSVLDWRSTVAAGIEVCGALGAAHAAGTLHRDLKPENVLVGPFGEARLGDFGIAAVDGGRRTTTGVASFTVAHVAPEVLRGQRQDERTDVYGLASTMHTLLAGKAPFEGDRDDEPVAAVMMRIIDTDPPRLGEPVPGDLADLLIAGLAKEPDERPQSAADLGEALQGVQRAHGLAVTPLRLAADAPTVTPVAVVPPLRPTAPDGDDRATIVGALPDALGADTDLDLDLDPDPAQPADAEPTAAPIAETTNKPLAPEPPVPDPGATVTLATPQVAEVPPTPPPPADASPPPPAPAPAPDTAAPAASGGSEGGRRRRPLIAVAAVIALVVIIGAAFLVLGGDDDGGDAEGTFTTAQIGTSPSAVAVNADAVWMTDSAETLVYKLDPVTGEEITDTGINNAGTAIALTDDGAGWIIGDDTREMIRIDLPTNGDTNQIDIGADMTSISTVGTDIWIAKGSGGDIGELVRFDAIALEATAVIDVGTAPNHVAATDDVVWLASTSDNTVTRVDPDTNTITATIDLDVEPSAIAAVEDAVWVLSTDSRSLTRIDPDTNQVVTVIDLDQDGGAAPNSVAATDGAVWVTDGELDIVYLVDSGSNEVIDDIEVGQEPVAVAATDADAWVANSGDGTLTHIDPAAFG